MEFLNTFFTLGKPLRVHSRDYGFHLTVVWENCMQPQEETWLQLFMPSWAPVATDVHGGTAFAHACWRFHTKWTHLSQERYVTNTLRIKRWSNYESWLPEPPLSSTHNTHNACLAMCATCWIYVRRCTTFRERRSIFRVRQRLQQP